jgi:hypothetical protein
VRFRLDLALASLYLAISVYAVLQPGGPFAHYLNLLILPWALLLGLVFCRFAQAARLPVLVWTAYLCLTVLFPSIVFLSDAPLPLRIPREEMRVRSLDVPRELDLAGSPMILWGWIYGHYVQTGTTWGTRTGGSHEILEPFFSDKTKFIADFVTSLESGRAPVFLDTATEGAPAYGVRTLYGHEQVPEVADAVHRNYFLCNEVEGARLFLHRERYLNRADILPWCASIPAPPP